MRVVEWIMDLRGKIVDFFDGIFDWIDDLF
jgi:hypothetical protein